MSSLMMVQQRHGDLGSYELPWILDRNGERVPGRENERRVSELCNGLKRHAGVRSHTADVSREETQDILSKLHDPNYLAALACLKSQDPVLVPALAEPGLQPDTPVCAPVVEIAREGVATAIAAARHTVAGARFAYALCRPPGHHAGPAFLGGYCYLNNAAAAAQTLHDGGFKSVGILDLDLHYPNGTSAIVERLASTRLYSLNGSPGANLPWARVYPRTEREHLVTFHTEPVPDAYLSAVAACTEKLSGCVEAIVLSLGYDTVAEDPHGSWSFVPEIFLEVGRLLTATGLPVCVIQEGGYLLDTLAECSHAFAIGLLGEDTL